MHPELARLLHHACRRPEDTVARLVLADWLEEHGDEALRKRGRYLRLRAELEAMRPYQPGREPLEREARALQDEGDWFAGLNAQGYEPVSLRTGLGLIDLPGDLATTARFEELAAQSAFAWVSVFHCYLWSSKALGALVSWGGLGQIGHLSFEECPLTPRTLKALVQSDALVGLGELLINASVLGDAGAADLINSPVAAGLAYLGLHGTGIGTEGADALATAWMEPLEELDLNNNAIGDDGLKALTSADSLPRLQRLRLHDNDLTADGARALVRAEGLGALRELWLSYNNLFADGIEALAAAPMVTRLEQLGLGSTNARDGGALALTNAPLERLRLLDLGHNGIGPVGIQGLARARWLGGLESLRLSGNPIGVEGARFLAAGEWSLRSLDLSSTGIGPEGVAVLLEARALAGMEELYLGNNALEGRAARALAGHAWPGEPPYLDLRHNRFTDADRARLRERFGWKLLV